MSIFKVHHAIMKYTALQDYNNVKAACAIEGIDIVEPKGKHWHKIEDATAIMLKKLTNTGTVNLARGIEYYYSI